MFGTKLASGGGHPPVCSEHAKKREYVVIGTESMMNSAPGGPKNSYEVVRGFIIVVATFFGAMVKVGKKGMYGTIEVIAFRAPFLYYSTATPIFIFAVLASRPRRPNL